MWPPCTPTSSSPTACSPRPSSRVSEHAASRPAGCRHLTVARRQHVHSCVAFACTLTCSVVLPTPTPPQTRTALPATSTAPARRACARWSGCGAGRSIQVGGFGLVGLGGWYTISMGGGMQQAPASQMVYCGGNKRSQRDSGARTELTRACDVGRKAGWGVRLGRPPYRSLLMRHAMRWPLLSLSPAAATRSEYLSLKSQLQSETFPAAEPGGPQRLWSDLMPASDWATGGGAAGSVHAVGCAVPWVACVPCCPPAVACPPGCARAVAHTPRAACLRFLVPGREGQAAQGPPQKVLPKGGCAAGAAELRNATCTRITSVRSAVADVMPARRRRLPCLAPPPCAMPRCTSACLTSPPARSGWRASASGRTPSTWTQCAPSGTGGVPAPCCAGTHVGADAAG